MSIMKENTTRQTSRKAYKEIKQEGKLSLQKNRIITLFKDVPFAKDGLSLRELSSMLNIEINAISGRVNELKKQGKLIEVEKRKCTLSHRLIIPVTINKGE